jgi:hypothetical protein
MNILEFDKMQRESRKAWVEKYLEKSGLTYRDEFVKIAESTIEAYMGFQQDYVMRNDLLDNKTKVYI